MLNSLDPRGNRIGRMLAGMAESEQQPLPAGGDLLALLEDDDEPVLAAEVERDTGETPHPTADLVPGEAGAADVDQHARLAATFTGPGLVEDREAGEPCDAGTEQREGGGTTADAEARVIRRGAVRRGGHATEA
jgi:hypothetical protein